ncbi:MAG: hypothetical protein U9Q22_04655 [Candidatus Altiarchaeota archaeon]|nr:hypothetical protein [Candidatus Altiarchaeota archaeon]
MIIIRTNHDIQTSYLFKWSNAIIEEAEVRDFIVNKIEGGDITERNLRGRVKKRQPSLIFFNGHGSKNSLINNQKKEFINLDSADVFKGTIAYTRACECLVELGPEAVEKGCRSFIGYKKKFWIARQHKWECNPLLDPVAKPILEGSNVIMRELLKGKSVDEAVKKSHEHAARSIRELIYSKEPLASPSLSAIVANDGALDFEGDASARI